MTSFGIIKERKNPPDKRVVLTPEFCQVIKDEYPSAQIIIEPSDIRVFKDNEYREKGLEVSASMEDCEVLLGVKEVPIEALIPNKKYFFFSHTIKKQPYNRDLLRAVLEKNISLYDHEVITSASGQRLVAFGRYAGLVGAYNGLRTYGLKHELFDLPKASDLRDLVALTAAIKSVNLPPIKVVLTGMGRVGNGAAELLDAAGVLKVCPEHFMGRHFTGPVYTQIDVLEYNKRGDGLVGDKKDFFDNPEAYKSYFLQYTEASDVFIAGHFYGQGAPAFFKLKDIKNPLFKVSVIADVSCDIGHPIPTTLRASTIADPIYGIDRETGKEIDFMDPNAIAVMAVDNLPCELPRDASEGFGAAFLAHVIPAFFNGDADGVLARAQMTKDGKLTERYSYLASYVNGK